MRFIIKAILFPICIAWSGVSLAQGSVDFDSYQKRFPENAAIYLDYSREITIDLGRDSILITSEQTERILHLNSNSKFLSKDKVFSSFFVKTKSIDAQTLVPEGNAYKVMKVISM